MFFPPDHNKQSDKIIQNAPKLTSGRKHLVFFLLRFCSSPVPSPNPNQPEGFGVRVGGRSAAVPREEGKSKGGGEGGEVVKNNNNNHNNNNNNNNNRPWRNRAPTSPQFTLGVQQAILSLSAVFFQCRSKVERTTSCPFRYRRYLRERMVPFATATSSIHSQKFQASFKACFFKQPCTCSTSICARPGLTRPSLFKLLIYCLLRANSLSHPLSLATALSFFPLAFAQPQPSFTENILSTLPLPWCASPWLSAGSGSADTCEGKCHAFCKCNEQSLVRMLTVPVAYVCCDSAAHDADFHPRTPGMSCHAFNFATRVYYRIHQHGRAVILLKPWAHGKPDWIMKSWRMWTFVQDVSVFSQSCRLSLPSFPEDPLARVELPMDVAAPSSSGKRRLDTSVVWR